MEKNRIVKKGDTNIAQKTNDAKPATLKGNVSSNTDINLIMDNSLKKYANEPFIVERTKNVDQKIYSK